MSTMFAGIEYPVCHEQKMKFPDAPMVIKLSLGSSGVIPEYQELIDEAWRWELSWSSPRRMIP